MVGRTENKVAATDFRGDTRTSIFDADASTALDNTSAKIVAWYANDKISLQTNQYGCEQLLNK